MTLWQVFKFLVAMIIIGAPLALIFGGGLSFIITIILILLLIEGSITKT